MNGIIKSLPVVVAGELVGAARGAQVGWGRDTVHGDRASREQCGMVRHRVGVVGGALDWRDRDVALGDVPLGLVVVGRDAADPGAARSAPGGYLMAVGVEIQEGAVARQSLHVRRHAWAVIAACR